MSAALRGATLIRVKPVLSIDRIFYLDSRPRESEEHNIYASGGFDEATMVWLLRRNSKSSNWTSSTKPQAPRADRLNPAQWLRFSGNAPTTLAERGAQAPLLILATARPEFRPPGRRGSKPRRTPE